MLVVATSGVLGYQIGRGAPGVLPATGDSVPDGILGGLVGNQVVPEQGVAQIARQTGSVTW